MEIFIGWILMGIFCCWNLRDFNETKGQQLLTIILAPMIFLCVVFDLITELLDSPAIGKK
jgi:hypothetical protein